MKIDELAERAVQLCLRRGAEQAEALVVHEKEKSADVFDQRVRFAGTSEVMRSTIRVFKNNRAATITGRGASERALKELVEQALAFSTHVSPDKFFGPAEPADIGSAPSDLNIFDQQLAALPLNRVEEIALMAEAAAVRNDTRATHRITSALQVQTQDISISASSRPNSNYRATLATLVMSALMDGGFSAPESQGLALGEGKLKGTATGWARFLDRLHIDEVAARSVQSLTDMAAARPSPSGWFPVVFAPSASRGIASMMLQLTSGPVVMLLGESMLGKIGAQACSSLVSLFDDGTLEGGVRSVPFDHEGVKSRSKIMIESGILREYLLNSYYARALQRRSTGNAVSNSDVRFGVSPSNGYISAGSSTPESIIADVRRGFYVTAFMAYAVPIGTNFTQVASGYWIEDGKLVHPVRTSTITAPLREMLQNIVAVGNDLLHEGAINSPTLLVSKMSVNSIV